MLRIIEQTEYLEQMLRKSAALSKEDRFAQGLQVGPDQLKTSIDLLMRNTQLRELLACCLLYTSPSPRDQRGSRMPSSA